MKIAMFTNTYEPMIGGIENSVKFFTEDLEEFGEETLIITPTFEGAEESTETVFRIPSVKKIFGSQYSLKLPISPGLKQRLDEFQPDLIHSHQPFMLGDTALRSARARGVPLVFTNHSLYERYASIFGTQSDLASHIAKRLPVEYANLSNLVITPTQSILDLLKERGVTQPMKVQPTGIETGFFGSGNREDGRQKWNMDSSDFVIGHVGRIVEAKNVMYLAKAVAQVLSQHEHAKFLLVGDGESHKGMMDYFTENGVDSQVIAPGALKGQALVDAYAAMDVFAFTSFTDTQGLVLAECMCAGAPPIALDAPGARDVIEPNKSGILLPGDTQVEQYAEALVSIMHDSQRLERLKQNALERCQQYDRKACAKSLQRIYRDLLDGFQPQHFESSWDAVVHGVGVELDLLKEKTSIAIDALWHSRESQKAPRK